MGKKNEEQVERDADLLIIAIFVMIIVIALATLGGKEDDPGCIAYWNGTNYSCEP